MPSVNIGRAGRRRRLTTGVIALATGVAAAAALVLVGASPAWRLLLLVPFVAGLLGVTQARTGT